MGQRNMVSTCQLTFYTVAFFIHMFEKKLTCAYIFSCVLNYFDSFTNRLGCVEKEDGGVAKKGPGLFGEIERGPGKGGF